MGVSHLFSKPYPIIVCLFLGIISTAFGKSENYPPNCFIDCTNLSAPEYFDCVSDFPAIHPNFLDFTTNGNQDLATFQGIGGISTNCSNLIITAQDFNFPPNACGDSLRVQRRYQISDGTTVLAECTRTFVTFELPIRITQHARNEIVSCEENVDSIFQEWLNAYGYTELFECHDPSTVSSLPESPFVFYGDCRVVDTLTNVISGEIRVQWNFEDDCGIQVSTIAGFFVIDSVGPTIDCPIDMTFDIGEVNLFDNIRNTLDQVQGLEDCSEYGITNDFENGSVIFDCNPSQDIPVTFTAIDSCQNTSMCTSNITIINDAIPQILCPPNIFLECGDINNFDLVTSWINLAMAEDNVGNPISIDTDFDISIINSSFCNQETDITFEATDNCGRNTSCVSRIIIDDNQAPSVNCPPSFLSNYSSPTLQNDIQFWFNSFTSQDLCNSFQSNTDLAISDLAYNCQDLNATVTYESTDECGNSDSCQSVISITDDYNSQINCPGNITLYCGDQDMPLDLNNWLDSVEASDNFGSQIDVLFDLDLNDPLVLQCHGLLTVNFAMTDVCGTVRNCSQSFEVLDTLQPSITCPPLTTIVSDPQTLDAEIQLWLNNYSAQDNCTDVSVDNNFSSSLFEGCDLSISNEITFTATDQCGLNSTCASILTIETDRFPKVTCSPNLTIECGNTDNSTIINDWINSTTAADFSGNPLSVSNNYNAVDLPLIQCDGQLEIAFYTIDNCNWTDTCMSTIFLIDNEEPTIICPTNLIVNNTSPDLNSEINTWLNSAMTSDNCLGSSLTSDADFSIFDFCNPTVVNTVNFVATDSCGLTAGCSATLEINNSTPVINCPNDLTLECGDVENENLINQWIATVSSTNNNGNDINVDNDLDLTVILSGCSDTYLINFSSEDSCLKSATCSANIIINDTESPVVSCPIDLNLLAGDPNKESKYDDYLNNISITDCNGFNTVSDFDISLLAFSCDDELNLPFTFTVTDDCGNSSSCELNIVVSNNIVASIDCPSDLNLICGDDNNATTISQWLEETIAEDNTGNSFPVDNNFDTTNPDLLSCQSSINVMFEMVDLCSMAITCNSNINITDNIPPDLVCPSDTLFTFEDPDFIININNWLNLAQGNDNCTLVSIGNDFDASTALGNCELETTSIISFVANDACGLTNNCTSNLTIQSNRIPTVSCPSQLNFECGIDDTVTINDWLNLAMGQDADNNSLPVDNNFDFAIFNTLTCGDTLNVTFTVNDNCNFSVDCNTNIVIEDTTTPDINCPAPLTINSADSNIETAINNWINITAATDNCGNTIIQNNFDITNFDVCSSPTLINVTFEAVDECGLSSTCNSDLSINKSIPTISCPVDLILECGISNTQIDTDILASINQTIAIDNAGNAIAQIANDFISGSFINTCQSSQQITLSIVDNCNQEASCSFNVDINDTTAPEINCPGSITIDIKEVDIQEQIDTWLNSSSATESCLGFSITNDYNIDLSAIDCASFVDVLFTATDDCNNSSTCNNNITFINDNDIQINCPDPIQVQCSDFSSITIDSFLNEVIVTSQDTFIITNDYSAPSLNCLNLEVQDITFEAEDVCNNSNFCTTRITYIPDGQAYIPNTFSPNNDGNNDYFTVFTNEFIQNIASMQIFSRWGEMVFSKTDFMPNVEEEGWDGRYNGTNAVIGVYVYQIEIEDTKGNTLLETGSLQLIR